MTPSMVRPCRSAARYVKVGTPALSCLPGSPGGFLDGREAGARLGPGVFPQRDHALLHRDAPDLACGRLAQDQAPDLLGDDEQLVDAHAALVPGLPARLAALSAEQLDAVTVG